MTKKKSRKKSSKNLMKAKQQDKEWRRLRTKIHTQLGNMIDAFMYEIESNNLEIDKNTEDYLIQILYNPSTIEEIEEKIKSKEQSLESLISAARDLATHMVKTKVDERKKLIEQNHAKEVVQEANIWPFHEDK